MKLYVYAIVCSFVRLNQLIMCQFSF